MSCGRSSGPPSPWPTSCIEVAPPFIAGLNTKTAFKSYTDVILTVPFGLKAELEPEDRRDYFAEFTALFSINLWGRSVGVRGDRSPATKPLVTA
jgi:hypothetical protein